MICLRSKKYTEYILIIFDLGTENVTSTPLPLTTLSPIDIKSILDPTTSCKNNSNCKHIYGAYCNKESNICDCKINFPASDGKKCYKGI